MACCFCVHRPSPPSLGRMSVQQPTSVQYRPVQSNNLGFLFLFFFYSMDSSPLQVFACTSCLGNNDIYFLSRFGHVVITVYLLLTLISWLKRLCLMRNACGDSWPCEITRETKVARKRTDREAEGESTRCCLEKR